MGLFRQTAVVSAMTMLSRILGLIRDVVLMAVFGAGGVMDAFVVAFKIPNFFRRLFAEGAFSQAFVPVLSEYKTTRPQDTTALIVRVMGALMLFTGLLTLVVVALAPQVITLFAPGFLQKPVQFSAASQLLVLTFPYLFFIALTAFFSSILQSHEQFALPALAPVLLNITMIAGALYLAPLFETPIMALGVAVLVAGILQMAILLPSLWRRNLLGRPVLDFKDSGVKRILTLMLPAIFGVSVTQINLLLTSIYASLMQSGSVTWIYNAERLSELPLGLIGVAIGTVILPNLSRACAQGADADFAKTLDWAARLIWLVGLPASAAMAMIAKPLMATLFMRGQFTLQDAHMSALALQSMAGGVLGFMLIKIYAPAFFARQNTKTPVRIGVLCVLANMVFALIFMGVYHLLNLPLHAGLALATSASSLLNATLLYRAMRHDKIFHYPTTWRKRFTQYTVSTISMVIALWLALPYFPYHAGQIVRIGALIGLCAWGACIYALTLLGTGFRPKELKYGT